MSAQSLSEAWEELWPIQREAAQWSEGSVLVLAGPGSGKTKVLTCRIARLLDSSRDENFRILALTFTNKAADEMRSRVARLAPGLEERLFLGTFHSFCAEVLRRHGTHLNINPNFHIYSQDADLLSVLNRAVEEAKAISDLVGDLDGKTLPVIKRLKSLLISPEDCCEAFTDVRLGQRMSIVYPAYEAELAKRNALDFDSLIFRAHQLFTQFPVFAKRYRTIYPYLCIDEFQDTNYAQYALVRALTGDEPYNLFVVADDDQIIYQWNGASHKRLVDFIRDYSATVLQLPVVYRCPPEIVDLANRLIRHNFLRTPDKKQLQAARPEQGAKEHAVRLLFDFPEFESEAAGIAQDISQRHSDRMSSIAVLGRTRRLLQGVERALHGVGLPAVILQRKDEFESAPFVWLQSILRLANDRQNLVCLESVCGAFAQLAGVKVDVDEVTARAQASNRDYLQEWIRSAVAVGEASHPQIQEMINQTSRCLGEGRDFLTFIDRALEWFGSLTTQGQQETGNDPTVEVFSRYAEERSVWQELMREITTSLGPEVTLGAFLQELQMHSKEPSPKPGTVVLMTIHGAKGKEFDHVYLVGLVDDILPSFQAKQKGENSPEMEEERRNCFVAITRTVKTLTLSYARKYNGWAKGPSRFLFEMGVLTLPDKVG